MNTQVGHLAKNRIVRDMQGNIIDWFDEVNGGWIIQKRAVVNKEAWEAHLKKEADKAEAAKAVTMAKIREDYPETKDGGQKKSEEDKVANLEKRVDKMDDKLDAILNALKK